MLRAETTGGAAMTGTPLTLDARLDLRAAGPLAQAIIARRGADLVMDAHAVDHLGALAFQVLRAAAKTWAEDGHTLGLAGASAELADQLALLGFTPDTVTPWEAQT